MDTICQNLQLQLVEAPGILFTALLHSSSSTFSIFISFNCLRVSISTSRYFFRPPPDSVSLTLILVTLLHCDLCWQLSDIQIASGWASLGLPIWDWHCIRNLFSPLVMLLQLRYSFLEVFSNRVYAPLPNVFMFTFTKFSKISLEASLPYSDVFAVSASWFIVFPIQSYSQMEYRCAEPKWILQLKKLKPLPWLFYLNVHLILWKRHKLVFYRIIESYNNLAGKDH